MDDAEQQAGRLAGHGFVRGRATSLTSEGSAVPAFEGESVAASLLASGQRELRRTAKRGEPRGIYCGIGLCHDCAVEVDGRPGVRTCMTAVADGDFTVAGGLLHRAHALRPIEKIPPSRRELKRDVVIIGGGPAGMAAAAELGRAGLAVSLIDERPLLGGQVYRRPPSEFSIADPSRQGKHFHDGARLIAEAQTSGAQLLSGHTAWGIWRQDDGFRVAASGSDGGGVSLVAPQLIVAAGGYDRPYPFPGWTLPGVMTAGGAQQLAKAQRIAPGQRVVIAGSGPLIPFFAVELHKLGVNVVAVAEASRRPGPVAAARFAWGGLTGGAHRLVLEGAGYLAYLRRHGIPMMWGTAIAEARGEDCVREVVLRKVDGDWNAIAGTEQSIEADCVCVNYGFKPSVEAAALLECDFEMNNQLGGMIPVRTSETETTVPGLFCPGDGAGIGGSVLAQLEGRIAGLAAAMRAGAGDKSRLAAAQKSFQKKARRFRRFKRALDNLYRVGPGIRQWWTPETILCRCEEVTFREVGEAAREVRDVNLVKVTTRAGMGRCQGRYCHESLSGVAAAAGACETSRLTPRLPIKPVSLGTIADEAAPARRNVPHGKPAVLS